MASRTGQTIGGGRGGAPIGGGGGRAGTPINQGFGKDIGFYGNPLGYGLEWLGTHTHMPYVSHGERILGNVLEALGSAPIEAVRHPRGFINQGYQMIRGVGQLGFELSPAKLAWDMAIRHKTPTDIGKELGDFGTVMAQSTVKDYKNRYGPNWRAYSGPESLSTLLDALTVLGAGARVAGTLGAAARLSEAGMLDRPGLATMKNLWKEANRPGLISEGQVRPRGLEYTTNVGTPDRFFQEYSASPLRRYVQQGLDQYAMDHPDARLFGAMTRVNRAKATQLARITNRFLAQPEAVSAINDLSKPQRTRLFWGAKMGAHDSTTLERVRQALSNEYTQTPQELAGGDPEFQNFIESARRQGFGGVINKDLKDAVQVAKADEAKYSSGMSPRYEKAVGAMQDMTKLTEQVIRDNEGFSALRNDLGRAYEQLKTATDPATRDQLTQDITDMEAQLKEKGPILEAMFGNSRGRFSTWMGNMGLRDSAVRQARYQEFTQHFGPEQAQHLVKLIDTKAWATRWENPAAYWNEAVGMPTGETAKALQARLGIGDSASVRYQNFGPFGQQPLIEGTPMEPAATSAFYSPLQRWVEESWPGYGDKPMPPVELRGALQKAIPPEEYAIANLDQFFEEHLNEYGNHPITQQEFQHYLANPMNAYNLREFHFSNANEAQVAGYGAEFGQGTLISREPGRGEYHEFVYQVPFPAEQYVGKGYEHWGKDNITFHMRLQDFAEADGHKAVVEEIQSDHASQFRAGEVPSENPWGANRYLRTAARRIMRHAKENGVDQVIISDPSVQEVRNAKKPLEGISQRDLAGMTNQEVRPHIDQNPNPMWQRLYAGKMKQIFDQEFGAEGRVVDNAYQGRYSGQSYGMSESIPGDMRGIVYDVTPDVLERADAPLAHFQRQPDWNGLPKGATELLADGRTVLHLFQGADASTVIHELGHIALHDLSEEDRAIVSGHFAGGKDIEAWTNAEHESFARAFEKYVRDGIAPTPELADTFKKLSLWVKAVWQREGTNVPNLDPEIRQVFDQMFAAHEPDIFIPDRPYTADLQGARGSRGIPRAGRVIGDLTQPRTPLFRRNKLALIRSGRIDADPSHLIEHMNKIIMLARANQLREAVAELGVKFLPGDTWDPESHYLVKKTGRGIDTPLFDAIESSNNPVELQQLIKENLDKHFISNHAELEAAQNEAWGGRAQLYKVDKQTVDSLFKHATGKTPGATTKPVTTAGAIYDATLDTMRAMLLYANPGFYVANMAGNFAMTVLSDPRALRDFGWSFNQARKAAFHEDGADHFWHQVAVEQGRGPTAGGLTARPTVLGEKGPGFRGTAQMLRDRPPGTAGRVADSISHGFGNWGRRSGRIIDDAWRVMVWKQVARKR